MADRVEAQKAKTEFRPGKGGLLGWAVLAFLFGVSGCSRTREAVNEIRIQLAAEPVTLDPALAEDGIALRVLGNTREGLAGYSSAGVLELRQAERVDFSPDALEAVFTLRKGLRWSDGQPLLARHFVLGLKRSLAWVGSGAGQTAKLASLFSTVRSIEASSDERKVIFKLREPTPFLLDALTLPLALPIPDAMGGLATGKFPELAPSNGPYRLVEHQLNRHYLLVPNPDYRDPSQVEGAFPVRLRVVADETTAVRLFEAGELDLLTRVPSLEVERLKAKGVLRVDPFHATCYLAFNVRSGPFREVAARRAVASAVRKEELIRALGTAETVASGFLPSGVEGALTAADLPGASGSASELRKGAFSGRVRMGSDSSSRNALILEKVQGDLQTQLGLQTELTLVDWKSYLQGLGSNPPSLFRFAWMMPFADPILLLRVFTTGNPNNFGGFSDPVYDEWVARIARLPRGAERTRWIQRAQLRLVSEQVALVPLYHYIQTSAVSPRLQGFRVSPYGTLEFRELRLGKAPGHS